MVKPEDYTKPATPSGPEAKKKAVSAAELRLKVAAETGNMEMLKQARRTLSGLASKGGNLEKAISAISSCTDALAKNPATAKSKAARQATMGDCTKQVYEGTKTAAKAVDDIITALRGLPTE